MKCKKFDECKDRARVGCKTHTSPVNPCFESETKPLEIPTATRERYEKYKKRGSWSITADSQAQEIERVLADFGLNIEKGGE